MKRMLLSDLELIATEIMAFCNNDERFPNLIVEPFEDRDYFVCYWFDGFNTSRTRIPKFTTKAQAISGILNFANIRIRMDERIIKDYMIFKKCGVSKKEWYHEVYLKSAHWENKKQEISERYNSKCAVCNSESAINVHHFNYGSLWQETYQDALPFCRVCHERFHNIFDPIFCERKEADQRWLDETKLKIEKLKEDIMVSAKNRDLMVDKFSDALAEFLGNKSSKYSNTIINNVCRSLHNQFFLKTSIDLKMPQLEKIVAIKRKKLHTQGRGSQCD